MVTTFEPGRFQLSANMVKEFVDKIISFIGPSRLSGILTLSPPLGFDNKLNCTTT